MAQIDDQARQELALHAKRIGGDQGRHILTGLATLEAVEQALGLILISVRMTAFLDELKKEMTPPKATPPGSTFRQDWIS
jgi:hypothetical protein